jgi:hypothetical protein
VVQLIVGRIPVFLFTVAMLSGAPVDITALDVTSSIDGQSSRLRISNTSSDQYRFDFMGDSIALRSVIADGVQWRSALSRTPDEFVIRTNTASGGSTPGREVVWTQYQSLTTTPKDVNAYGPSPVSQQATLAQNNLYIGTDNLFENAGSESNGNYSTAERVDFLYDTAIEARRYLALIVLERGMIDAHDGFQVAAVLSRDPVSGLPTSYGALLSIEPGWGSTSLGQINTTVLRRDSAQHSWTYSANVTGQHIGGVLIHLTDLVATGTPIYGYSLFARDVNANLTQWRTFATNTTSGLDMLAANVGILNSSPEPGTILTLLSGAALLFLLGKRRVR